MTTVEKLNNLISIKQDIKTAIENKGVDMTGVSFPGYASKIGDIASGVGYTDRDIIEARYQYKIANSASFVYSSAFEYKDVQTVDLPNCLYVGSNGFYYCTNLTTVNIPVCTSLYNNAFRNCTNLTTVNLPSCTDLHSNAFRSCYNLNTIYMGIELSTVASMRSSNALLDCSALQSIYVPASLVDKYKSATNWSYYSSIIYPFVGPEPPLPEYYINWSPNMSIGTFRMEGVTYKFSDYPSGFSGFSGTITVGAFYNAKFTKIETNALSIENAVLFEKSGAFESCSKLTQISLPMCSYIGDSAFYSCYSLTKLSLPVCEYIGGGAFGNCYSLTQISLPVCSYIDVGGFLNCITLTQASLPVCEYIGHMAFAGCSSLTQASLPVCSYIGINAFEDCSSLTQLSLPVCSYIGSDAFNRCSNLKTIRLDYSSVVTLSYRLYSIYSSIPSYNTILSSILVPSSLVAAYKADSVWSQYSSRIYPINT